MLTTGIQGPLLGLAILWLVSCAVVDLRTGLVPNVLTLPLIAGGTLYTLYRAGVGSSPWPVLTMLALWVVFTVPWLMGMYGGGDQKLLMALSSLCPVLDTAVWVSVGMIMSWLVWLAYRRFRAGHLKRVKRWHGTWMLVPGGIIVIAQQILH